MTVNAKALVLTLVVLAIPFIVIGLAMLRSQQTVGRIDSHFRSLSLPAGYELVSSNPVLGSADTSGQGNRQVYEYRVPVDTDLAAAAHTLKNSLTSDGCEAVEGAANATESALTAQCSSQKIQIVASFKLSTATNRQAHLSLTVKEW